MELVKGEAVGKLFRVWRTVLEMLRDRGYLVTGDEAPIERDRFNSLFGAEFKRSDLDLIRPMRNDPADKICVFFPGGELVREKIDAYLKKMNSVEVTRAIFVVQDKPTPLLYHAIYASTTKHLEFFMEKELVFNVSQHCLVPRHEAVTSDEKQQLLEQRNIKLNKLPWILQTDPQARYLGLKPGDLVKITRKDKNGGECVIYRLVVKDGSTSSA